MYRYIRNTNICSIISTDFSQGDDGWNHGQGLWSIQTNGNGISANNPYLLMNPIAATPKRGVVVWNENANWTGNYASKNVTGLSFQVRNASIDSPLYLRIAIGTPEIQCQEHGLYQIV